MNAVVVNKPNGRQVVSITGASILGNPGSTWRKFTGVQTDKGIKHQFNIKVDEEFVQPLKDFGFDVKWYERDAIWYLAITISWRFGDPGVFIVTPNMVETQMTEQTIGDLDNNGRLDFVDMEIAKSHWTYMGSEGYSAYASDVYIYLGQPSASQQRFMERRAAYQAQQPEPAQIEFTPVEDNDIPF